VGNPADDANPLDDAAGGRFSAPAFREPVLSIVTYRTVVREITPRAYNGKIPQLHRSGFGVPLGTSTYPGAESEQVRSPATPSR